MAPVRFGTDGIRGRAGSDLTTEVAYCLGMAVAEVLGPRRCIVGRDTRESGPLLSAALVAGLGEAGADDPYDVGVLPTPGVAHLCAAQGTIGAVISASHNPFFDNGIKVLGPGGTKLRDDDEAAIEAALARLLDHAIVPSLQPPALLDSAPSAVAEYSDHLVAILPPDALAGMSIVVDCANGAASAVAPEVLRRLGATVHVIGDQPDGQTINDGVGSTHPERLAAEVLRHGAQLGLALDGDADRLIAVDEDGDIVDGDALLCLFALDAKRAGRLAGDGLVVTVMSNLGLHRAMAAAGIEVVTVAVGDRHVASALDERGLILGGEQSGHIIFADLATTGDGALTGIMLADLVRRSGESLSALASSALEIFPQVLEAVHGIAASHLGSATRVHERIAELEIALGDDGRILVRASGTEPVVRVMVEASDAGVARAVADELCDLVTEELGAQGGGGPVT